MNIIDKLAGAISPEWALGRKRATMALNEVTRLEKKLKHVGHHSGERRYEAAGRGRRTDGWQTAPTGANAEIRGSLRLLRDRSRDLVRNNPFAKKAVQVVGANVVGSGIRASADLDKKKAKRVNAIWGRWADSSACDYEGQRTFTGLQRAVVRAFAESGEALVIRKRLTAAEAERYGGIPIQLQILESDFLDTGKDGVLGEGQNRVIQGVEFDATSGRRVAYWLFKSHPGEAYHWGDRMSIRVPAEDVLHIYEVLRPGQVRGVPMGVSTMLRLRDFDEYEDAQLIRQKIAACFAVFYNGTESLSAIESQKEGQSDLPDEVQPGMIQKLPSGSTVSIAEPPKAEGYGEYSKTVLQSIAAGFGITYEQLTGDYSNVNYSSARMARLEMGMYVAELQELVITQFCTKVWEWFTLAGYLAGSVGTVTVPVKWTVPARFMLDPVKETKALKDLVRSGFMSYSEAVLSLGYSPDELREQIKKDNEEADSLKLKTTSDPRYFQDAGVPITDAPAKTPAAETKTPAA